MTFLFSWHFYEACKRWKKLSFKNAPNRHVLNISKEKWYTHLSFLLDARAAAGGQRRSSVIWNINKWIVFEINIPGKKSTNPQNNNSFKILCCKEICYSLAFVNLMSYLCEIKQILDMHPNINCSSRGAHFQGQLVIKK